MFEEEKMMEDAYKALAAGDYINALYLFNQQESNGEIKGIHNYNYALIFIRRGCYDEALEKLDKALRDEKKKLFHNKDESTIVSINKKYLELLNVEDREGSFFKPLPYINNRVVDYYQICIKRMMAYCYYRLGNMDMLKIIISELVQEYERENLVNFLKLIEMGDECTMN